MSAVDHVTQNEEIMRRWVEEAMNQGNTSVIDETLAPNFVAHALFYSPYVPQRMQGKSWNERIKENLAGGILGLENHHTTIDQMISAGDKVVTVTTLTGTRNGKQIS